MWSIEKNKDVRLWKEFFDYKLYKIHRTGSADGDKQKVIVCLRPHQF